MKKNFCFSLYTTLLLCLLFTGNVKAQKRDDSLPEAKPERPAKATETTTNNAPDKPYNGNKENQLDKRDEQTQQGTSNPRPPVQGSGHSDADNEPSITHELGESAKARAVDCVKGGVAAGAGTAVVTKDPSKVGAAIVAGCVAGTIKGGMDASTKIINGEVNNCELPAAKVNYNVKPKWRQNTSSNQN